MACLLCCWLLLIVSTKLFMF